MQGGCAPELGVVFFHLSVMRNMQESVKNGTLGLIRSFWIEGISAALGLPVGFVPKYYIGLLYDLASCVKCDIGA